MHSLDGLLSVVGLVYDCTDLEDDLFHLINCKVGLIIDLNELIEQLLELAVKLAVVFSLWHLLRDLLIIQLNQLQSLLAVIEETYDIEIDLLGLLYLGG